MVKRLLLVLASLTFAGVAFAGEASDLVKAKQTEISGLLKTGGPTSDAKIAVIFDEMIDYDAIVSGALGTVGASKCSAAEQKTIGDDMKKLIQNTWRSSLKKTLGYTITYGAEDVDGDATIVKTTAAPQSGDSLEINYKLKKSGGKLKVVDIQTETVWLVGTTWRSSFTKIINDKSCAELIKKLTDKLAKP